MTESATWPRDDADALDAIEFPAPGTVRRGTLRFSHPTLADWSWPYTAIRGSAEGPRLALTSGVHPAEYPAIESNIRFMRGLDPAQLRGSVISLPLIDVPAFLPRTPFVNPIDSKNPNRFFPGDPNGTFTDVMDDAIFRAVIAPSDYLVDLHGGDMVESLAPFSIYSASGNAEVDAASDAMARAFGLRFLVRHQPQPGLSGMTIQAAAAAGIPSIIAEAGSCGLLTEPETQLMVDGVGNVLRHLGMLDGTPTPSPEIIDIGRTNWLASPAEGMWYPAVAAGDRIEAGQIVGRIGNLYGDHLAEITAPHDGHVLFVTSSPAMRVDGLVIGIGER